VHRDAAQLIDDNATSTHGNVVFIFADGHSSIASAAEAMHELGFKGNVAVIGSYVDQLTVGYLSLRELKNMQDSWGWNILNHSWYHREATNAYQKDDVSGIESDILKGMIYLIENGINSDPNWYVAPEGIMNETLTKMIAKYYSFDAMRSSALSYPYGASQPVKNLTIEKTTTLETVTAAIDDAMNSKQTLFLTFHRIQESSDTRYVYPIADFKKILDVLVRENIHPITLAELDSQMGVKASEFDVTSGRPEQISLSISAKTGLRLFAEKMTSALIR
jgi:hypothetical protein